jgi:glucosamine-phosphate N-acetyltransferase
MFEIKYVRLIDLIENAPNKVEVFKKQYLSLMSELTSTIHIETSLFKKNIERIDKMGIIIIGVLHDLSNNTIKIIASGTLIIEPKIIRGGKNVGHIEDIVVSENMRGKGISQELLNMLKTFARENNCYKVILDCDNEVKNVYIKNGLDVKGVQMAEYFT